MKNELQDKDLTRLEVDEMSELSIYLLMEAKGADVFGLWSASKSELLKSYERQIGFRI